MIENLVNYVVNVLEDQVTPQVKYFYKQLYRDYNPDVNGYTLVFMVPPDLSGYRNLYSTIYKQDDPESFMGRVAKMSVFNAIDFSPPQGQVNTENISARSGSLPYATEVQESEQCSITFLENSNLDIYTFHHVWYEYIREILEGMIEPADEYINPESDLFGAIDYYASFYIVKYQPDLNAITFIGKCLGTFPQGLPNKELIGSRTSNELTTLPFTYFCSIYRETVMYEFNDSSEGYSEYALKSSWLFNELQTQLNKYNGTTETFVKSQDAKKQLNIFDKVNNFSKTLDNINRQIGQMDPLRNFQIIKQGGRSVFDQGKFSGGQLSGVSRGFSTYGIPSVRNVFPK